MSVQVTQNNIVLRKNINDNNQRYGVHGKRILESETVNDARALLNADRKNLIINGDFRIWQRGNPLIIPPPENSLIITDKWRIQYGQGIPSGTMTYSKQSDSTFQNFLRITNSASLTIANVIETKINGVNISDGRTLTLSFFIKSNDVFDFNIPDSLFQQNFGSGGTPAPTVTYSFSNGLMSESKVTNQWKKIIISMKFDSMENKILGTNNDDHFRIYLSLPITNGLVIDIANAQLEKGNQATEFEYRPLAEELKLCQRYYQKSYDLETNPGTITTLGQIEELSARNTAGSTGGAAFKTRMRAVPTVTLYSPNSGASGNVFNVAGGDVVGTVNDLGETGWSDTTITGALHTEHASFHYTADAEL